MMNIVHEIENMSVEARCFLLSIVFQVCGALILLLKSFSKTHTQVATAYFEADKSGEVNDDDYVELSFWSVSKILRGIYYNRISFICLVIGYSLAIWADIGDFSKNRMFQCVSICSVLVLILSFIVSFLLSVIFASFHKKIRFKDLRSGTKVNIVTGTSRNAQGEEVVHVKTIVKK